MATPTPGTRGGYALSATEFRTRVLTLQERSLTSALSVSALKGNLCKDLVTVYGTVTKQLLESQRVQHYTWFGTLLLCRVQGVSIGGVRTAAVH